MLQKREGLALLNLKLLEFSVRKFLWQKLQLLARVKYNQDNKSHERNKHDSVAFICVLELAQKVTQMPKWENGKL